MASLRIDYLSFLDKVKNKNMDFREKSIAFKSVGDNIIEELRDISSVLSFDHCWLVVEDYSVLNKILLNNVSSLRISISHCTIFIRLFNFADAANLHKYQFFDLFENNEVIIYNGFYEYNKDSLEDFDAVTKFFKGQNNTVALSLKTKFVYYPEDFDRYIEILKAYKIQNIHFDFLYTTQHTSTIPNLSMFSNVLGQLRIRGANLSKKQIPFCYNLYIEDCRGAFTSICRNITITRCRDFDVRFLPGAKINLEEGSYGKLYCKGKFSIFFDNPSNYDDKSIEIVEGSIRSTNKKSLLKERYTIYKFKLFINEDFSFDDKITKFYKCKFLNCYFNSNQYLLDCEYSKCFFSEGMDFVINT